MNVNPHKFLLLVVFCALAFSSCSFKKRIYTKGFYTSSTQSIKKPIAHDTVACLPFIKNIKQLKKETYPTLFAQVSKTILANKKTNYPPLLCTTNTCDTIILKSGAKLLGTITKVSRTKIFFKNCDSGNYFSSTISKNDVSTISFANGNKNFIKPPVMAFPNHGANLLAAIGFILTTAALILLAILFLGGAQSLGMALLLLVIVFFLFCVELIFSTISIVQSTNSNNKPNILALAGIFFWVLFITFLLLLFK